MKIINFNKYEIESLRDSIIALKKSWEPLVIRRSSGFSREDWKQFLMRNCGFSLDRRHYGFNEGLEPADWWEISYQPSRASSYAYSKTRQPFHTDNAWFSDPAQIVFFIMEKQAISGGEQTIYPIVRLIDDLAKEEPSLLNDLMSIEVLIKKGDGEHFNKTTIISSSPELRISWNYYRTDKSSKDIALMCESFFSYLEKKEKSKSVEILKCETGDSFCFNDLKLLHGRTAFEAREPYDRVLLQSMWKY